MRDYAADAGSIEIYDTATGQQLGQQIDAGAADFGWSTTDDGKRIYVERQENDTTSIRVFDALSLRPLVIRSP